MTRRDKILRILSAANHNAAARRSGSCNALYMGSGSTCQLFGLLGGSWPNESLEDVLARATDVQLDKGLEHCANILKHVDRDAPANRRMSAARRRVRTVATGGYINITYKDTPEVALEAFRADLLLILGEEL